MSGHSKWHSIKHKKAKVDAARGKIFTRLIKEVTVAARMGGGDPEMNPRLRLAIQNAKSNNMPAKNIENAIKKGTGELPGVIYEEIIYEGYGPGGAAVFIEAMTDNKNRTVAELRHLFSKYGGNLGESGSVAWIFEKKGIIKVAKTAIDEESLMMASIEAGAEDIKSEEPDCFEIYTEYETLDDVKEALENNKINLMEAEKTRIPQNTVQLDGKHAEQMLKLMEVLDDHDDIQEVYSNFDIDDEVLTQIAG